MTAAPPASNLDSSTPPKRKRHLLRNTFLVIVSLLVIFLIVAALQPSKYTVARTATIAAPPDVAFNMVNDFHNWEAWSPWAKLDPDMKASYEGPPAGKGAIYTWTGNSKVGEGKMTITDSRPNDRVDVDLQFIRPFEGKGLTSFTFKPVGAGTEVTWSMAGEKSFAAKAIGLFVSMDRILGGQFEQGLTQMNRAAQAREAKKE